MVDRSRYHFLASNANLTMDLSAIVAAHAAGGVVDGVGKVSTIHPKRSGLAT